MRRTHKKDGAGGRRPGRSARGREGALGGAGRRRASSPATGWPSSPTPAAVVVVDLAICAARAITVPIYASNTPDEVPLHPQALGAVLLFVDNDEKDAKQAGRLTRVRAQARRTARRCRRWSSSRARRGRRGDDARGPDARKGRPQDQAEPGAFEERVGAVRSGRHLLLHLHLGHHGRPEGRDAHPRQLGLRGQGARQPSG